MHLDDIKKSPLSKQEITVDIKDLNREKLLKGELSPKIETPFLEPPPMPLSKKAASIKIEKTVTQPNGSTAKFNLTLDHAYSSAEELNATLEAIGYNQKPSMFHKIGMILRRTVLGVLLIIRDLIGGRPDNGRKNKR